MKVTKPMITQTYYIKKLMKSSDFLEFYQNSLYLIGFINRRMIQTIEFRDPFLYIKSL